jgi:hypothetical protein
MDPKALEKAIRRLLREDSPDDQLRTKLETLAEAEENFSAFTWLWGPVLYKRNHVLFRPLVLSRFGQILRRKKYKWEFVRWKGEVAAALEPWLAEADRRDDIALFRRLYEWKLSGRGASFGRDLRQKAILGELPARFHAAPSSAAREIVVQKFAIWFSLDEATALELYRRDPHVAGPFIFRHLPWSWLENKRAFWRELLQAARAQGDEKFQWELYRRQVPRETWEQDVAAVCERVRDPAELVRQLDRHHPHDRNRSLGAGMEKLLALRGRDVVPYVLRHLTSVRHGFLSGGDYGRLLDLARSKGWWDLWAAIIRVAATPKDFNREVGQLVSNTTLERTEVTRRLGALCGVSRELNFPGFGLAAVHQLDESTALALLARYPEMLRGPFLAHLQVNPWMDSYSKFIDALIAAKEEDLLDHVAARIATRVSNRWAPKNRKMLVEADRLADYYDALKVDDGRFSRRAASVLNRIPAYTIHNYNELIRDNRLARLLFARSAPTYLAEARSVRDLVEAAEIHVMALGYRALGLDDDRARSLAAENLSLLLGTLLRPLHRSTRGLAFRALANAAGTCENATRIHAKAREALDLPDEEYPKEALLALIAGLVDRWPELRGAREEPVVYRRTAA